MSLAHRRAIPSLLPAGVARRRPAWWRNAGQWNAWWFRRFPRRIRQRLSGRLCWTWLRQIRRLFSASRLSSRFLLSALPVFLRRRFRILSFRVPHLYPDLPVSLLRYRLLVVVL